MKIIMYLLAIFALLLGGFGMVVVRGQGVWQDYAMIAFCLVSGVMLLAGARRAPGLRRK